MNETKWYAIIHIGTPAGDYVGRLLGLMPDCLRSVSNIIETEPISIREAEDLLAMLSEDDRARFNSFKFVEL